MLYPAVCFAVPLHGFSELTVIPAVTPDFWTKRLFPMWHHGCLLTTMLQFPATCREDVGTGRVVQY